MPSRLIVGICVSCVLFYVFMICLLLQYYAIFMRYETIGPDKYEARSRLRFEGTPCLSVFYIAYP